AVLHVAPLHSQNDVRESMSSENSDTVSRLDSQLPCRGPTATMMPLRSTWHRLARAIREGERDVRAAGRPSTIADTPSVSASGPGWWPPRHPATLTATPGARR